MANRGEPRVRTTVLQSDARAKVTIEVDVIVRQAFEKAAARLRQQGKIIDLGEERDRRTAVPEPPETK